MPRTRKTSEIEIESKPVRKTRQTASVLDSPVRRSTRIKQVVDSSPESEKSITAKREFRKKNPNPDKFPTPGRVLRNRSPSNDIENTSQASRKLRKRASPEITNIGDTTRSARYSRRNKISESEEQKTPSITKRKTRANSLADEDISVTKKIASSSKNRKREMSCPTESSLLEEEKSDNDETLENSFVEVPDDSIIIVDEISGIKSVVRKKEKVVAMEKNLMKRLISNKLNYSGNDSLLESMNDFANKKERSLINEESVNDENIDKTDVEEYFCEPMDVDISIANVTSDTIKNLNVDNMEKIVIPERIDRNFKPRNSMIEIGSEKHLISKSRYSLGNKIPESIIIDEIKNKRQEEKRRKSQSTVVSENLKSKSNEPDENILQVPSTSEKRLSTEKRKSILDNSIKKNSLSKSPSFHLLVTPDKEEFLKSNKEEISKSTERKLLKSREKINRKRKRISSDEYDTSNNDFELTMYEYDSSPHKSVEKIDSSLSKENRNESLIENKKTIAHESSFEEGEISDSEEAEKENSEKKTEEIIKFSESEDEEVNSKFLDKIFNKKSKSKSKSLGGSEIVSKNTTRRGFKSLDRMSLQPLNSFDSKREMPESASNSTSEEEESSNQEDEEIVERIKNSRSNNKSPTTPRGKFAKLKNNVESDKKSNSSRRSDDSDSSVSRIPTFMFSQTSESEETGEDASRSIDSDIAREYNLSGKDISHYSDDDVPGDNCRDSESEHSDSNDDGSDLADFIADDDEEDESNSDTELYEGCEDNKNNKKSKQTEIVDEETGDEEDDIEEDDIEEDDIEEDDIEEDDIEEDDNEGGVIEEDNNEESENKKENDDDDESDDSVFTNDLKSSLQLYKSKLPKKIKHDEKEVEEEINIQLEKNETEEIRKSISKNEIENKEEKNKTSSDETESPNRNKLYPFVSPVLSKSRSDKSLSDEEEKGETLKKSPDIEKSIIETKQKKKSKRKLKSTAAKVPVASSTHYELSDAEDEPQSLSFAEGLIKAADEMRKKAESIKEGIKNKEGRKKKKKNIEENTEKSKSDDMKRLPDEVLQDLEDVPRPNKRQKILKKENSDSPARGLQQPRPGTSFRKRNLTSVSSFGSTTEFDVVNLQKEKKTKTQSSLAMKWFKQRMLARNARQPISVYLNQQKKRRAANKDSHSN